jgi:hypothetical protein
MLLFREAEIGAESNATGYLDILILNHWENAAYCGWFLRKRTVKINKQGENHEHQQE